ncbi:similar to Saccharomyces cerevisiae YOR106W VAM3 Syntaxin-like vacuolar t-SNARE that functions with Vam7p in vacuolar protein trafficking [Maudiozyma saulgeensis]|uniref:Similar to Saccharomyces cerevisiae YOR106W VAM3 Syntaxin-like vacuolar t-SNARE that functions with Vam7p in vacuolar protein trafficking n=1 Tax=Maudiozyma saulgeensis TaxID=1789683 RepID=A0A1X7QZR6_9SACH|nr:similar to Saccharomyces cerevisiae YOR106W VAM3 Syntaxin-like vacuolar t-SNARE that functions with Vam7p in vacuolar protein trafficking [Kazachstania saulgeensis]
MSFLDLENQRLPSQMMNDTGSPSNLISEFATQVKILSRLCHQLETTNGSIDVHTRIKDEQIPLCHAIRDQIISLRLSSGSKLDSDYQAINVQLNKLENKFNSMKKITIVENSSGVDDSSNYVSIKLNEQTSLLDESRNARQSYVQTQQQLQQQNSVAINQEELDFHTIIHQGRDTQVSRIHDAVSEVNTIFRQLGSLIQEQGEQVDTISENINQFGDNTQRANEQLKKADENQRKRNKCGMITLVIICVVFLTIILVIIS